MHVYIQTGDGMLDLVLARTLDADALIRGPALALFLATGGGFEHTVINGSALEQVDPSGIGKTDDYTVFTVAFAIGIHIHTCACMHA